MQTNQLLLTLFTRIKSHAASFKHTKEPIILSLNIQSLNSKFEPLKAFVQTLLSSEIPLDIIVLQETWELRLPNLVWIKNSEREPLINLRNANDYFLPMPRTEALKNLLPMHCQPIGMNYSLNSNIKRTQ